MNRLQHKVAAVDKVKQNTQDDTQAMLRIEARYF